MCSPTMTFFIYFLFFLLKDITAKMNVKED